MKVGVVIPVWNRAAFLPATLRSVLREAEAAALDVVVVDDGSNDDSYEVACAFAAQHACIRVLRQPNAGPGAARTAGLAVLQPDTELVAFLDSDDLWPPGRLAPDLAVFREHPDTEVVYARIRIVDAVDEVALDAAPGCREMILRTVHMGAGLYRRATLARVGPFDTTLRMAEDVDFLLRLFERQPRTVVSDHIAMIYRIHDESLTADLAASRRWFMRALHKAAARRRANPSLRIPEGLFDLRVMRDAVLTSEGSR